MDMTESEKLKKQLAETGMLALDEAELEAVAGGRTLYHEGELNRNSWFVSLLSMLVAEDAGRPVREGEAPRVIFVDGKPYRLLRVKEGGSYKVVLEEMN